MITRCLRAAAVAALVVFVPHVCALTDAEASAGRALVKRYADTIIGVEMVVTIKAMQGDRALPTQEQKREVNGTVLTADGLTVLSLGEIDPRGSLPPQMRGIRIEEPEFKEVKLRLADNTEIPARVVLKDADLDLAFVAPLPGGDAHKLPFVDLANAAKAEVLGNYYLIFRGNKQSQRTPMVQPNTVIGIVEKPRQLFMMSNVVASCPSFDADGRVLGVVFRHQVGDRANGFVVLPAADLADSVKEAVVAAAKPPPAEPPPAPAAEPAAPAPAPVPAPPSGN